MSNTLLTLSVITREAVRLWKNSNAFIQNIDTQYDDQFAVAGAKAGTSIRIRLPNDYVVRTGAAASTQDTAEQSVTLTVATQKGVDVSFSTVEKTMALQDYSKRVLAPMVNNLAGAVAADVMSGVEGGVCNGVFNQDGSGNTIAPTATTVLLAGALLDINSAAQDERKLVTDPYTMARSVSTLSGLFNPAPDISRQYRSARIYDALNFDWMQDQTVLKHVTGSFSAGTVNGAGQTGQTLVTNAITGTLKKGDLITLAGSNAVNRITKQSTGQLRQFVVLADAANGATSLSLYPAIVPSSGGNAVQYQTVDNSPANGATIALVNKASETYRKNIAFAPQAVTMAMVDLYMPTKGVVDAARESFDGCSMRMITYYNGQTDQEATRLDVLYGYLWVRPEWACAIGDSL
jgi:hypothetical protein